MNGGTLEKIYQERLEERLISYLAETNDISLENAMDIYYRSNIAGLIHEGKYGVQYLDYKVLAQMLRDTEPELFENGCAAAEAVNTSKEDLNTTIETPDTDTKTNTKTKTEDTDTITNTKDSRTNRKTDQEIDGRIAGERRVGDSWMS